MTFQWCLFIAKLVLDVRLGESPDPIIGKGGKGP